MLLLKKEEVIKINLGMIEGDIMKQEKDGMEKMMNLFMNMSDEERQNMMGMMKNMDMSKMMPMMQGMKGNKEMPSMEMMQKMCKMMGKEDFKPWEMCKNIEKSLDELVKINKEIL